MVSSRILASLLLFSSYLLYADFEFPQGLPDHPKACVVNFDSNTISCDGNPTLSFPSNGFENDFSGLLSKLSSLNIPLPSCLPVATASWSLVASTPVRPICFFYPQGTKLESPSTALPIMYAPAAPFSVSAQIINMSRAVFLAGVVILPVELTTSGKIMREAARLRRLSMTE